ncbi:MULTISPECIES: hypothetical protein [unclassified Pseudoalteromonas]|uniref:hypothetical protein n=1 Tax=Pseudoalteromonas sp. S554 TaxID=2066516 RepID=UPI000231AE61|nr:MULTISPECIES: hypothetical protein [unclassified Pseudoalteromonas]TMS80384.1 hypothetical protein CWB65_15395 [Pseudoalteromonas sp. S554]GAA75841.1 hypothetical protein P20480_2313 [Pseudoalteromonas sp. BSi20480]|tara:strand:- start:641 stop:1123 length:483 start_codon:yes stop_codon:yes gene_type:complete
MAKSISVLPEQEQQYLTITGKASIALAFFLLAELLSTVISKTDSVIYLLVDLTLFASFIYFLVLGTKSMKFAKHISKLGFWTYKFNDEYVDYVSSLSLRATCHIMVIGGAFLAYSGDSKWFVELIAPFNPTDALQILLCLAAATHGALIFWKLGKEELYE